MRLAFLAALDLGLAALLAFLLLRPPSPVGSTDPRAAPAPESPRPTDIVPEAAAEVDPGLFAVRPTDPAPAVGAASAAERRLGLVGIVKGADRAVALLRLTGPDQVLLRAGPGDDVAGWTLVAVDPRAVVLRREGASAPLVLSLGGDDARLD